MQKILYQYLLQNKNLPVPGIGTFLLERKAAISDFTNRKIDAPTYSVELSPSVSVPSQLYNWLGHILGISSRDAVVTLNDFAFNLKKQITAGDSFSWYGIGHLSKSLGGEIKFVPNEPLQLQLPVTAEKVLRNKAEHLVRVGEEHKTSEEMTAMLTHTANQKSYGWVWAASILLLAFIFIGWHFSQNGFDISAVANCKKLAPLEAPTP